ncbi:MAG: efflux transporter outer membrane subunit [Kiritimatiellaeota bacterium]|nr:efflux transporter outer membrane subunit [Kiritimatiellota bacterium]
MSIPSISAVRTLSLSVGLLLFVGCVVGPDFAPVNTPLPPNYTFSPDESDPCPLTTDHVPWWHAVEDALLVELIEEGMTNSLTLAQAAVRVEQARAALSESQAGYWPNLNASASMRRVRTTHSGATPASTVTATSAGLDAAWELDLFGRLRRTAEAAEAMLLATEHDLDGVRLSLSTEIAATYVSLRATQESLAIARENLAIQQDTARIARDKTEAGAASKLDQFSTEAQTHATLARIPQLEAHIALYVYALEHLLGHYPGALAEKLGIGNEAIRNTNYELRMTNEGMGVPSDLLRQRPDIAKAEAHYHAQLARVGIATAHYYPSFSINGNVGVSASALDTWGNAVCTLGLGPAASWNFLSFGRTRARVRQAEAAAEEAAIAYRATVLAAVHEVEAAWLNLDRENARNAALAAAVDNQAKATDLAKLQYASGKIDYLNLLNAQTALLAYQEALSSHAASRSLNTLLLIKALGGAIAL